MSKLQVWGAVFAILCGMAFVANGQEYNRVAILHGVFANQYGKNIHNDEYDATLKKLGWSGTKFASTIADMDRFTASLDQNPFDLVLICPLFNYAEANLTIDMTKYAVRLRKFIEEGGAVVVSDVLYPDKYRWLTAIDPALTVGFEGCKAARDIENVQPADSLRFFPNEVREGNTWGHLALPAGHGWKVIATCSEGKPQTVVKRLGKGYFYLTGCRIGSVAFLENFRANLEIQRMGLLMKFFEMPQLVLGNGTVPITLQTLSNRAVSGKGTITVTPQNGSPATFTKKFKLQPNQETTLEVPYSINSRGEVQVVFTLGVGTQTMKIFDRTVSVPDLLTLQGPSYRGFAVESELRKNGGRTFAVVDVLPYKKALTDLKFQAVVKSADGKQIGKMAETNVSESHFKQPLEIGLPAPGVYTMEGKILENGQVLQTKTAELTVLLDKDCPVYINEDMNLVTNGEEFFPIGIYHLSPKAMDTVAEMGFNTVQMFSWFSDEAFTEAAKHDIWVLYEQNHRLCGEDWVGQNAVELSKKFSNILMWYGMDEPTENAFDVAKKVNDVYHRFDKGHPTFVVSYMPTLFASQVPLGDVFAPDPYPYPNRPITMVSDWMDRAWAATKGDKPVICVPQSFGNETPETLRAMAYLALTHEARGLIWYPWNDGGTSGLVHHPELHPTMKALISEIKTLSPALLNRTGRRQFRSANGQIHGLFCEEKTGTHYMLLVNSQPTEQTLSCDDVKDWEPLPELRDHFDSSMWKTDVPLKLKPYETRTFSWK